jgi:RimJ/RimL family protein N-acetyltransferase
MHALHSKPDHPGVVFKKYISELSGTFSLRSVALASDGDMLVNWVNQPYAKQFWQMEGDAGKWLQTYEQVLANPCAHAFIGCLDETPICQLDLYSVHADELGQHIEANSGDAGFHILMGPPREMQKGFSFYAIKGLQEYYFSFDTSGDLYAEPDQENYHANRLAINTGFRFINTVTLSYKTANVYRITRTEFLK